MNRTLSQWVVYWILVTVLLLPTVPISIGWYRLRKRVPDVPFATKWVRTALAVQSISILHIALLLLYPTAFAPHQRSYRHLLICAWLALSAATLFAVKQRSVAQAAIYIAGANLVLDWFYFLFVSSVV